MKGTLLKSKALTDEWMVRYTTYKTIPGIKGVMGSHSRMPESNYIPIHPDNILYLCPDDNGAVIDFEITEVLTTDTDGTRMMKYAKLINEEKRSKQKRACTQDIVDEAMRIAGKDVRAPKCVRDGIVKRMYTEKDIIDAVIFGMRKGLSVGLEAETDCDWVNNYVKSIK